MKMHDMGGGGGGGGDKIAYFIFIGVICIDSLLYGVLLVLSVVLMCLPSKQNFLSVEYFLFNFSLGVDAFYFDDEQDLVVQVRHLSVVR